MMAAPHPFRSLLLGGLLVANLLVLALATYTLGQSRRQYELRAETLTQNIAAALDQNLSHSIEKIDLALDMAVGEIERELAGQGVDPARMEPLLARLTQHLPEVDAMRFARADGVIILGKGVDARTGASWADRDFFIYHREHDTRSLRIAKAHLGRIAHWPLVGFSRRVNGPGGRFAGVVSSAIPLDYFTRQLAGYELGARGTAWLRDADLDLITRVPSLPGPAGAVGSSVFAPEFKEAASAGVASGIFRTLRSPDGVERTVSFRRLGAWPLYVAAGVSREDNFADWRRELYNTTALCAGFALLSLLLGRMLLRLQNRATAGAAALREREAQLRTLIEVVPDSIQFKDGAGRWLVANVVCLRSFELEGEAWEGCSDDELGRRHPRLAAEFAACKARDEAAWERGGISRSEQRLCDAEGNEAYYDVITVPLRDARGRRQAMVVVGRDISERKRAEAELERHRRHLEELVQQRTSALLATEARASHILESSADGLYGVDATGRISFINPAGCALLGYRAEEVIGRDAHTLFHHSRADGSPYPAAICPSHGAMSIGEKVRVDDEVYWHADGHAVPVMYATHPMVEDGRVTGAVTSFVDISTQRAAAQAREVALAAAENLAQVRREFLANMSHEIRTPLNGVLGFADIGLRNAARPEKAREAFGKILASGQRLLGVINDILDFSKIEAGKMRIEATTVELAELVAHSVDLVRERARSKGVELRVTLAPDLPPTCCSDPLRLGQVLLNVLSNAVKFTAAGSVALGVARRDDTLAFSVEDTGIGMSAAELERLFDPFHQADASASRRYGGTGLGLAISKRILGLMGGSIRVASEVGRGTRVDFEIPYVAVDAPCPPQEHAPLPALPTLPAPAGLPGPVAGELAGLSLLVVEDEPVNQTVIEENLRFAGARVTVVGSGGEAIEHVRRDGADAYDAVLMDLQMPDMDGYAATRALLALAPDLPVIAQSAHAFDEARDKCLAAGMVGHVAKPIDFAALAAVIRQHAPAARFRAAARNP